MGLSCLLHKWPNKWPNNWPFYLFCHANDFFHMIECVTPSAAKDACPFSKGSWIYGLCNGCPYVHDHACVCVCVRVGVCLCMRMPICASESSTAARVAA